MLYLDLDELPQAFAGSRWWSCESRNLASWRRADYLRPVDIPLREAVERAVVRAGHPPPAGPIRMLAHARYFGYCFNPVTFYYCFDPSGRALKTVVAEITNTPWRERHCYVLSGDGVVTGTFDKAFHVSPFVAMDRAYRWRFTAPGQGLWAHMDVLGRGGSAEMDASLCLRRRPLGAAALNQVLRRYPAITAKVIAGIHWEAFKLWLKRVPVFDHPHKAKTKT